MGVIDKCGNDYLKRDITFTQNDFTTSLEAEGCC